MAADLTVPPGLHRIIEDLALADHHAHGVSGHDLSRVEFEAADHRVGPAACRRG